MNLARSITLAACVACLGLTARGAFAADSVQQILHQLDEASAKFHSTQADFQFDAVETDPIPITDTQKGTVYYERKGNAFQMAAHINEVNGKPVPKLYTYTDGKLRLFEPMINQVTTITKASNYSSYIMLGFGASGKDLSEKWDVKALGPETVDGAKTEKLELTAKDPTVRKNLPKVTIWLDMARGVSLRQVFDEGAGQQRICHYFNFKMNEPLPGDAFTFKTDGKTTFLNQ
ncbi:MAG: outer membrane lipoprotein-sorting protein [Terracidiphilus sp.]